jgi:hypothetical protein
VVASARFVEDLRKGVSIRPLTTTASATWAIRWRASAGSRRTPTVARVSVRTCAPTLSPNRATRAPSPTTSTACASISRCTPHLACSSPQPKRRSPSTNDELHEAVDNVWALAHESQYAALSDALTELLPRLEHAVREDQGDERKRVHALRARAYQAAAAAFARQDEADAAWVAADRAISAAELSGSPLEAIAGHFRLAHAFIRLGRLDQAEHVTASALDVLQRVASPAEPSPERPSLNGAMHLVQASSAVTRATAHEHTSTWQRPSASVSNSAATATTSRPSSVPPTCSCTPSRLPSTSETQAKRSTLPAASTHRVSHPNARPGCLSTWPAPMVSVGTPARPPRHCSTPNASPGHVRSHHLAHSTIRDLIDQLGRRAPTDLVELARRSGAMP